MLFVLPLALAAAVAGEPLTLAAALDSPTRHVRTEQRAVRRLLALGFTQSPTFASLVARLERSDVIVYIEQVARLQGGLEGRLVMLPRAGHHRYVRVQIASQDNADQSTAILGHELRHAVEVADAVDVSNDVELAALYRRIGIDTGHNKFDTNAAQEIGRRVLKELTLRAT